MASQPYFDIVVFEIEDVPAQVPSNVEVLVKHADTLGYHNFAYNALLGLYALEHGKSLDANDDRVHLTFASVMKQVALDAPHISEEPDIVGMILNMWMDMLEEVD